MEEITKSINYCNNYEIFIEYFGDIKQEAIINAAVKELNKELSPENKEIQKHYTTYQKENKYIIYLDNCLLVSRFHLKRFANNLSKLKDLESLSIQHRTKKISLYYDEDTIVGKECNNIHITTYGLKGGELKLCTKAFIEGTSQLYYYPKAYDKKKVAQFFRKYPEFRPLSKAKQEEIIGEYYSN